MKLQKGNGSVALFIILIWVFAVGGWIANIVKIVLSIDLPLTGLFVFRCIGIIVAPLGAILGWF